jgi:TonB family protein
VDTLEQAIPLLSSPNDRARAYNQLGVALTKSNHLHSTAKAEEALRTAADLGGPWGRLARYNLAEVLLKRQRWADAAEAARQFLNDAVPGGMAVKEARIVLCRARSHLPQGPLPEPEQESEPIRVGGEVSRPEILFQTGPVYPEKARRAGATGLVIVEGIIDTEGCVTDIRVLRSLRPDLDEAAVAAVRRWVFAPAMLDGKPVKVYYVLTVNFQIEG